MNTFKKVLSVLPLPVSGVMLAIASLGILLMQFFGPILNMPYAGFVLQFMFGAVSAVLWVMLILKAVLFPAQIRSALHDPILASVAGTFPMATMAMSVYLAEIVGDSAVYLWYAGVVLHAVLIVFFSIRFLKEPKLSQVFPSWLVVYVGIVLASITAPYFNQIPIGQICFWFGLAALVPLLPALLIRCTQIPIPEPAKPLVCIFAAPISIILAGYVQSFSSNGGIVSALLLAETFVLVLVLLQLPKLLKLPFYPSYAAFTFPFVVTATAYLFGIQSLVEAGFISVVWYVVPAVVILFAAVLVVYVFVRYVREVCKAVSIS